MHIPDGILDGSVLGILWIVVLIYGVFAIRAIRHTTTTKSYQPALQGVLTAMVFAFQMLNFPISAGTSGHLLGFVLLAILVSPSAAFLMIATVLLIQATLFADGGLLAYGANVFNMGIVPLLGYFVYWGIRRARPDSDGALYLGSFLGAWVGVVLASIACGIEIGVSSLFPYPVSVTLPSMAFYHVFIGIGEGLITMFVLMFFKKYAPEYLPDITKTPLWS